MKKIPFPLNALEPFQSGNVWELKDSFLRIGDVGKHLVHYRHYKGQDPRGPLSITGKRDLAKYLTHSKAMLVQKPLTSLLRPGVKKTAVPVRG